MKSKKILNLTALLLVLLLLLAGMAAVTPATALKVSGARIALDVAPGTTATSTIGITAGADESEADYAVEVLGFGQDMADGTYTGLAASADANRYSARPFITVDQPTVHLKPGESVSVTAAIAVPADAKDGGRYAIILVHPAATASGQQTAFTAAVAIPVLLTIRGGTVDERGEITGVKTSGLEIGKPFTVTATMSNTGNLHYYGIVSNVSVTDTAGTRVASARSDPMSRAIIPGNQVNVNTSVVQGLPEGTYQMTVRMETQDGDLLDTETTSLRVGITADASPTRSPGPGVLAVCAAAALGLCGGRKGWRKE